MVEMSHFSHYLPPAASACVSFLSLHPSVSFLYSQNSMSIFLLLFGLSVLVRLIVLHRTVHRSLGGWALKPGSRTSYSPLPPPGGRFFTCASHPFLGPGWQPNGHRIHFQQPSALTVNTLGGLKATLLSRVQEARNPYWGVGRLGSFRKLRRRACLVPLSRLVSVPGPWHSLALAAPFQTQPPSSPGRLPPSPNLPPR